MNTDELIKAVRSAWSAMPAPPAGDLQHLTWLCGEGCVRALTGIPPVSVDIASADFMGCTPLLDLAPQAAAAYLGSFLLSLLDGLAVQEKVGLFCDVITRAHVLTCLGEQRYWQDALRPHLPSTCRAVLKDVAAHLAEHAEPLSLAPEDAARIVELAAA